MTPGQLLARAFVDDPLTLWAESSPSRRLRTLTFIFSALDALADGRVDEPDVGVVLWKRPNHLDYSPWEVWRSGMWKVGFVTPPWVLRRFSAHEDVALARTRPFLTASTGYLALIAVDPSQHGRGHGSRLLTNALTAMGKTFDTCVLRTEQPKNVAFYLRHGFSQVDHHVVPASGLPMWVFRRSLR